MNEIERLKKEIEELELQLDKNRFSGIFERGFRTRQEKKLAKLRKALEKLEKK